MHLNQSIVVKSSITVVATMVLKATLFCVGADKQATLYYCITMVAFYFIFGSILSLFCFVVVPYMIAAFVGDTVAFLLMLFVIEFKFGFLFHYYCIFSVVIFLYVLLLLLLLLLPLLSCTMLWLWLWLLLLVLLLCRAVVLI